MSKVSSLLEKRLKKETAPSKMAEMGRQSVQGHLTSFSGIFNITDLTPLEKDRLQILLEEFSIDGRSNIEKDLTSLIHLTSEVKAINNQAALLHGERIKKAQSILTRYREGAFTAWLITTYGNRQTPYNFLYYYNFYENLPKLLRPKLEKMPRQAIYTLASREGPLPLKQDIIENYNGETKNALLEKIREVFPLQKEDKRAPQPGDSVINSLARISSLMNRKSFRITKTQKQAILGLLEEISQRAKDS